MGTILTLTKYIGSKLWNELDNVLKLSDFVYIPLNTKYQSMNGTKMSLSFVCLIYVNSTGTGTIVSTMVNILVVLYSSNRCDILNIVTPNPLELVYVHVQCTIV